MLAYEAVRRALRDERLPALFVDLDAFDRNLERHARVVSGAGLTLRLATKSVRVPALIRRVAEHPAARGLLCFSVAEAAALAARGLDDLFVAYPTLQRADLEALADLTARGVVACVAIDSPEGAQRCADAGAARGVSLRVALCADMSLRLGGGRIHLGVRRSPLHEPADVAALAERARELGLTVHGLLGYDAQVAGLGDDSPFDAALARIGKRVLRRASMRELSERRARITDELRARGFALAFVNGGGTGSLDLTSPASGVTEASAGSGLYKPLLFDGYTSPFVRSLEPSCFFALEATRRPARGFVTCLGGGYVASGAVGADRLPRPVLPERLSLTGLEGAGEVQTPLEGPGADGVELGAPVVFRHAKAGEVMERFREVLLVRGDAIVERAPTYRGEGLCFV